MGSEQVSGCKLTSSEARSTDVLQVPSRLALHIRYGGCVEDGILQSSGDPWVHYMCVLLHAMERGLRLYLNWQVRALAIAARDVPSS